MTTARSSLPRRSAVLFCLVGVAFGAHATLPATPPESFLELEGISAHARETLFLIQYSLQPVCDGKNDLWSAGINPEIVFAKEPSTSGAKKRWEILQQTFGAKPGQAVFLVDQPLTPYGLAGIRTGDIVEFGRGRPKPEATPGVAKGEAAPTAASEPAYKAPEGGSVLDRAAALSKFLRERAERIYSRNPVRTMVFQRNGAETSVGVRMVKVCNMHLVPLDSKYSYAESNNSQVLITRPLLQNLSHAGLVVVLAHEAAHVALGLSKDRVSGKLTAKLFLGKLAGIGENIETETGAPNDTELIQADRLAMRVATGLGIEPAVYVATLRKLVAAGESFGRPDYERTRPLNAQRQEALDRSVRLWGESKRYTPPRGVELGKVRDAYQRARAASKSPNPAFVATSPPAQGETEGKPPAREDAEAEADPSK